MKFLKLSIFAFILTLSSLANAQELSPSSMSYYEGRISNLESQLRDMRGQLEREVNNRQKLERDIKKSSRDMEMRMSDLERSSRPPSYNQNTTGYSEGRPPLVSSPPPNSTGNYNSSERTVIHSLGQLNNRRGMATLEGVPTIGSNPNTDYEYAFSLIRAGKHADAEMAFSTFLDKYPDHKLASNASYWKAETYYVRADYSKSAKLFAKSYQKYPKGAKSADNLLKLGLSLSRLNKKTDACLTFKQLRKEVVNSNSPVLRKASEEEKRLGCE